MKLTLNSFLLLLLCVIARPAFSQSDIVELSPGYYVVVAAYAETKEDIAIEYVNKLKKEGHEASHGFNSSRGLYFVYLKYYTDLKESINGMLGVRRNSEFKDSWVRVVPGDIKPVEVIEKKQETPVVAETKEEEPADESYEEPDQKIIQYDHMTLGNTEVFLSLFSLDKNRIVDGEVEIIDSERSKTVKNVKGNEYLILPDPKSNSGKIKLVASVFGYQKVEHEFNYNLPLPDTLKPYIDLMGTTFVVHFNMARYKSGDKETLTNIFFYNDAALLLPESMGELNGILQLMKDEPNYRIRIHGHTNGNFRGKIITVGPSKNYFTISQDSKTGSGSSQKLSEERAQVIKLWLMDNGIDGNRVEVKGWGGKEPLFDKMSVNAKKNVRVELEVL